AETRHLHQDAAIPLALARRLDQAELADALANDFDRLIHDLPGTLEQRGLRGGEPDHSAPGGLAVERARAGAADEAAARLGQFPGLGQRLLQVAVANDHRDRLSADDRGAGQSDARLAQDAADIVLQR